jgi:DNA mismatch repair protein MutS2
VGTGTDPDEGAALGVAIVDFFRRAGATTIATTHYNPLKTWASQVDGVLNASVEFDEETLRPTYRLIVGVAGSSAGLEIARRMNLPKEIIEHASEWIDPAHIEASGYLKRLKKLVDEQESLRSALEEERQATADKYALLDIEFAGKEADRQREFESQLAQVIRDFTAESQRLLETVKDRATASRLKRESEVRASELRKSAAVRLRKHVASAPVSTAPAAPVAVMSSARPTIDFASDTAEIHARDRVRIKSLGQDGSVESISDGQYTVLVGSLKFRAQRDEIQLITSAAPLSKQTAAPSRGVSAEVRVDETATQEINVIGQRADEATDRVDKFLDEAYMAGAESVRIVHGHGTGALRRAIAELLTGHTHVDRFKAAPSDQGGTGATIAELKK